MMGKLPPSSSLAVLALGTTRRWIPRPCHRRGRWRPLNGALTFLSPQHQVGVDGVPALRTDPFRPVPGKSAATLVPMTGGQADVRYEVTAVQERDSTVGSMEAGWDHLHENPDATRVARTCEWQPSPSVSVAIGRDTLHEGWGPPLLFRGRTQRAPPRSWKFGWTAEGRLRYRHRMDPSRRRPSTSTVGQGPRAIPERGSRQPVPLRDGH